jgi:hypothetical protein
MIGGDHADPIGAVHGGDDLTEALVDNLDGGDGGRQIAGVPDHVGIGQVDDRELRLVGVQGVGECRGDLAGAWRMTALCASSPVATWWSIRVSVCGTVLPAPSVRCPTSELPIWPSGSPTLGPLAVNAVWG